MYVLRKQQVSMGILTVASIFSHGTASAQPAIAWMTSTRAQHTATLMNDGRVLLAGGDCLPDWESGCGGSAEIYDPASATFTRTGSMSVGRYDHAAVLLPDGRVLIAGGTASRARPIFEVEVYSPQTGLFSVIGKLSSECSRCFATPLDDGRVIVGARASAEIFDPKNGSSKLIEGGVPDGARPILLPDRRIFFIGGTDGWPGIYDIPSDSYRRVESVARYSGRNDSVARLLDGSLLVSGGDASTGGTNLVAWYQFDNGEPSPTPGLPGMRASRAAHTSTTLPDGTVLFYGGVPLDDWKEQPDEIFDPATRTFRIAGGGPLRSFHTATLLSGGTVLMAGGCIVDVFPFYSRQCWEAASLYMPEKIIPAPKIETAPGYSSSQGAILHTGTARVVTAGDPAGAGDIIEIFVAGLAENGRIPPRVAIGGAAAEVLFHGAAPGFPDLFQVNVRVPQDSLPGPAVPVRINYLDRPSNEVTIGVR